MKPKQNDTMKDTFYTLAYRSGFIHGSYGRDTGKEFFICNLPDGSIRYVKSIHAAKLAITNHIGFRAK